MAYPVGAPRGFGVVGRQAKLNLKQFFVNLKSTMHEQPGLISGRWGWAVPQATHRALSRQPDLGSPRTLWSNAAGHRLCGHSTLPPRPPAVPLSNHSRHRPDSMEIAPRPEGERAASAPGPGHTQIQWSG